MILPVKKAARRSPMAFLNLNGLCRVFLLKFDLLVSLLLLLLAVGMLLLMFLVDVTMLLVHTCDC